MKKRIVCWFSCGAASAVATKLTLDHFKDDPDHEVVVVRNIVREEHPDNDRFAKDCEDWFGVPIIETINEEFDGSIYNVFLKRKYMAGIYGAPCTMLLKKEVRKRFERHDDIHVFGFTVDEEHRLERLFDNNNSLRTFDVLIDRELTHADCLGILTKEGIDLPVMYKLGYKNNNCFSGQERFVTDEGFKTFAETEGQTFNVMTRGGWAKGEVKAFGRQPLVKLTLTRGAEVKEIMTTDNHRWIVPRYVHASQGYKEVTTRELEQGSFIPLAFKPVADIKPSEEGIRHGFVMGDGTLYNHGCKNLYSKITFCGDKGFMAKYFSEKPTKSDTIHGLHARYKDLPKINQDKEYLLGFIVGLIASDGTVSKTGIQIDQVREDVVDRVIEICFSLGMVANKRSVTRDTPFKKNSTLYTALIPKIMFRKEWLLRQFHKDRFGEKRTNPKSWKVESVETTQLHETVYCLQVEGSLKEFTLEGGVLTGNCVGCVKGGAGYWNKIREDFPEEFDRACRVSRQLGAKLIKVKGKRVFLDELPKGVGRYSAEPEIQCGILCETEWRGLQADDQDDDDCPIV